MVARHGPGLGKWIRFAVYLLAIWFAFQAVGFLWGRGVFDKVHHGIHDHDVPIKVTDSLASSSEVTNLCRAHGWRPFRTPSPERRRKVYDLIMINTELDWLEIRLNTLYAYVDYFVIVESSKTFTGLDKPLVIKENMNRFSAYHDKIIYHELEYPPDFQAARAWDREDLQRDATYTQVFPRLTGALKPALGDAMVVADVDEIPRPETLTILRHCEFPRRLTLRSRFYYYSFQFLHRGKEWDHPQATFYEAERTIKPSNLRIGDGGIPPIIYWDKSDLWNAGWHCSSCFQTMEELLTKMKSFSHTWMNDEEYRDKARIAKYIRTGKDLWDREGEIYDRLDNNTDLPSYLLEHPAQFEYLLDRDGPSAGFTDYKG